MRRRDFLKVAGQAGAAAFALPLMRPRRALGRLAANEKVVIAIIGCGGMGRHHLNNLLKNERVRIAALCDVWKQRYTEVIGQVSGPCDGYQDFRRVLDRKDIDAIWVATPEHWHALIAIHGCQAWKDVYVEKPLTTSVYEGRKIVEAARRYGRVVQVGIQQRSMEVYRKAIDIIHSGGIGKVCTARAWVDHNWTFQPENIQEPPADLDWDLWLGPAPKVPYSPERFWNFRLYDDYAGGQLTNWGPHLVDIALWGMNEDSPLSVAAVGGSYRALPLEDEEIIEAVYEFKGCTMTWTQTYGEKRAGKGYGTSFQGDKGTLVIDRESYMVEPKKLGFETFKEPREDAFMTVVDHHNNFLDCIHTRKRPNADVEIGHRSTSACLLANIAVDCRRQLHWDGQAERFINDEAANRHLYRPYRAPWHL